MSSYGNVKNQNDLESRKRQHAETLQLMIENEGIKQKKLADYKNPNKPPPIPPQYKTPDEMTKDVMLQEKLLLDNVKELGLDEQQSMLFLQALKNKTAGIDSIVRLNRNFPSFKKSILEKFNPKALTAQLLSNIFEEFSADLDAVTGLRNTNQRSTNFYADLKTKPIEDYADIDTAKRLSSLITKIQNTPEYGIQPDGLMKIQNLLTTFTEYLPSEEDLYYLASLLPLEERQMSNLISTRVNRTNIPTKTQINNIIADIDAIIGDAALVRDGLTYAEINTLLLPKVAVASKQLSFIESPETIKAMQEIKDKIRSYNIDFSKVGVELGVDPAERAGEIAALTPNLEVLEGIDFDFSLVEKKYRARSPLVIEIIKRGIWRVYKDDIDGISFTFADIPTAVIDEISEEDIPTFVKDKVIPDLLRRKPADLRNIISEYNKFTSTATVAKTNVIERIKNDEGFLKYQVITSNMPDRVLSKLYLDNIDDPTGLTRKDLETGLSVFLYRPMTPIIYIPYNAAAEREYNATINATLIKLYSSIKTYYKLSDNEAKLLGDNFDELLMNYMFIEYGVDPEETKIKIDASRAAAEAAAPAKEAAEEAKTLTSNNQKEFDYFKKIVKDLSSDDIFDLLKDLKIRDKTLKKYNTKSLFNDYYISLSNVNKNAIMTEIFTALGGDAEIKRQIADEGYKPFSDPQTRKYPKLGFGMKDKISEILKKEGKPRLLGEGYKISEILKKKEKPRILGQGSKPPADTIHIDINSHNGRDYKAGEGGFMHRKIKIGKGITAVERPRYEKFGKYTIHMPQLINESVLNVKYRSLGGVPSLKPTVITDNYKDFILNTLETGKVNNREFDTLADNEKEHFTKIAKGAGLIETLKIKNSPTIDHTDDIQRFNLLKGEFDAGNNNDKLIKELKGLVMKFIGLGKLNKKLGLEFLMQLNLV